LQAAALPENYFTVWTNVFQRGHLQAGESFLVHGGSSGIGLTAIQLAKAFGAKVLCTVGNADKVAAFKPAKDGAIFNKTPSSSSAGTSEKDLGEPVPIIHDPRFVESNKWFA
jgi:NADPH:quinone reductase-like Zn-dependent oxidoreductase